MTIINRRSARILILCVGAFVLLTAVASLAAGESPRAEGTLAWAEKVRAYQPGAGVGANFGDPTAALGPDDADPGKSGMVMLGNALTDMAEPPLLPTQCEAYLILEYVNSRIVDGKGIDIGVFEVASGGVAEATWVYVGKSNDNGDLWLYAGETGGSIDGVDISGVASPGEQFNLVALCDKPDGITSGSPFGGPDIDAVAALDAMELVQPDIVVRAQTPGVAVNDVGVPAGEASPPLKQGDSITLTDAAWATVSKECGGNLGDAITIMISRGVTSRDISNIFTEAIDALPAGPNCESVGPARAQSMVSFEVRRGDVLVTEYDSGFDVRLSTPLANITTGGRSTVGLAHDPAANRSELTAFGQSLIIKPAAFGKPPFFLGPAQRVTVTDDGAGPIIDLDQVAMPAILRP